MQRLLEWVGMKHEKKRNEKIAVVGMPNAGKSTFFYRLQLGHIERENLTEFFIIKKINFKIFEFVSWDLGSSDPIIKASTNKILQNCTGLIIIVDSAEKKEFVHLEKILKKEIKHIFEILSINDDSLPILLFANKQDLPNSINPKELFSIAFENIDEQKKREVFIQPCSTINGDGVSKGIDWLCEKLQQGRQKR